MITLNVKIAIAALRSARVRTILTMTGIVIGVASVTLIMALGEGIKREVGSEIHKLGGDVIQIRPGATNTEGLSQPVGLNLLGATTPSTLNERDLESVEHTKNVTAVAPMMIVSGHVSHGATELKHPFIIATTEELPQVLNVKLTHGEFFNPSIQTEVAVIGRDVANKLLGTDNQVGGKITVRGQDYTVIGILDSNTGSTAFGGLAPDLSKAIFIPFEAGKRAYQGATQIQEIEVKVADHATPEQVTAAIHSAIKKNHGGEEDFSVITQQEALQATSSIVRVLTTFTAAIASISLLVGGIGIMNIMLVSVTERTKEIGIRKSIGATNGQILGQFLIEAMVISVGGGLIGVALAFITGSLLSFRLDITPTITLPSLFLAFGVSTTVGILFGIAPAVKAARKDPIEALRHE